MAEMTMATMSPAPSELPPELIGCAELGLAEAEMVGELETEALALGELVMSEVVVWPVGAVEVEDAPVVLVSVEVRDDVPDEVEELVPVKVVLGMVEVLVVVPVKVAVAGTVVLMPVEVAVAGTVVAPEALVVALLVVVVPASLVIVIGMVVVEVLLQPTVDV